MIKRTLLFTSPAYLSSRRKQIVVKKEQEETTIPAEDVGMVVLEHPQVTVSRGALELFMDNKAVLLSCDHRHMPQGLLVPMEGHSELQERYKAQLSASEPLKKQLWKQTVESKIENQAQLLNEINPSSSKKLFRYSQEVVSGDITNLEARAANHYWKHLFEGNFTREREGVHPNSWLNYGYAILRAAVARGLVMAGLLPALGIFHKSKYNAFCLADDIMEPFRPFVDAKVMEMISNPFFFQNELSKEIKVELLNTLSSDVQFQGQTVPFFNAVVKTTSSVANCFLGVQRKIHYPQYAANRTQ